MKIKQVGNRLKRRENRNVQVDIICVSHCPESAEGGFQQTPQVSEELTRTGVVHLFLSVQHNAALQEEQVFVRVDGRLALQHFDAHVEGEEQLVPLKQTAAGIPANMTQESLNKSKNKIKSIPPKSSAESLNTYQLHLLVTPKLTQKDRHIIFHKRHDFY